MIGKKIKILFLEQLHQSTGSFLDPIVNEMKNNYHVKYLKTLNHTEMLEGIRWADIVWLEWANQVAIHVTNNIPEIVNKKVICRLHGYEVFTNMPAEINWKNVHKLIFVADHKKEIFNKKFEINKESQIVIRNGIDIKNFTIPVPKCNTKKLVLLGNINFRKGFPTLLHFYQQLLKYDPTYHLYVRGNYQDERLEMASKTMIKELNISDKLEFVGWVENLNKWFEDKSHILSFSLEESFHYAIGDGMSAGLKPVIHAWNESRKIWPKEYIFKNLDEFFSIIQNNDYDPKKYRRMIVENGLDLKKQIGKIEAMIKDLADDYLSKKNLRVNKINNNRKIGNYNNKKYIIEKDQKHIESIQKNWISKSPFSVEEINKKSHEIFSKGQIVTMKCERFNKEKKLWEVEFAFEYEQKGAFLQFIIYNEVAEELFSPFEISKEIKSDFIKLIKECLKTPNIILNDNNIGIVFDRKILQDMKNNYKEYVWERMYPATIFAPLNSFLKHMGRYEYVKQFVKKNDVIVDAACGIGYGAKYLSINPVKIYAIDLSSTSLSLAKKYYHDKKIEWIKKDVTSLPISNQSIDCFVSMETFEHLDTPSELISEMKRVLKVGGSGFISTPNGDSPMRKLIKNPYHIKEYNYGEIHSICSKYFKNVNIYGQNISNHMVNIHKDNNEYQNFLVRLN